MNMQRKLRFILLIILLLLFLALLIYSSCKLTSLSTKYNLCQWPLFTKIPAKENTAPEANPDQKALPLNQSNNTTSPRENPTKLSNNFLQNVGEKNKNRVSSREQNEFIIAPPVGNRTGKYLQEAGFDLFGISKEQAQPLPANYATQIAAAEKQAARSHVWLLAMEKCQGIARVHTHKKVVALTFDDGPNGKYTKEILAILDAYHVKATFFMIGENIRRYPKLTKTIFVDGDVLANHTYSHFKMSHLDSADVNRELAKTSALIYRLTGAAPILFRPPYGVCSALSTKITQQSGYKTIIWSAISNDYDVKKTSPEKIARDIIALAHPGGILVLHDGGGNRTKTVAALPIIIETLQQKGYRFITLPQLLKIAPYQFSVIDRPVNWGYQPVPMRASMRFVDTIIIHSVYGKLGNEPNNLDEILKEDADANITPHYIITRDGMIYRLAPDAAIARHANRMSQMPDRRINVNKFSIGVALINSKTETPTNAQYFALTNLINYLETICPIHYILGQNQIAPLNTTDPWNFDWKKLSDELN